MKTQVFACILIFAVVLTALTPSVRAEGILPPPNPGLLSAVPLVPVLTVGMTSVHFTSSQPHKDNPLILLDLPSRILTVTLVVNASPILTRKPLCSTESFPRVLHIYPGVPATLCGLTFGIFGDAGSRIAISPVVTDSSLTMELASITAVICGSVENGKFKKGERCQ